MGSGYSKESTPTVVESGTIVITKEVEERWRNLRLQQSMQNGKGTNQQNQNNENEDCSCGSPLPTQESESESKKPRMREDHDRTETGANQSTFQQNLDSYENLNMFGKFLVHTDAAKLRDDLETGTFSHNADSSETRYTSFLKKPVESSGNSPKYEEIDETVSNTSNLHKRTQEVQTEFNENLESKDGSPYPPNANGMHVPKAVLPVVIDEDSYGHATIETITAWKIRDQMHQQRCKQEEKWRQRLENVTSKIENETRKQALDVEKRINEVKGKSLALANKSQPNCSTISSQIGQCYEENQNEVLKCSGLVKKFADCSAHVLYNYGTS